MDFKIDRRSALKAGAALAVSQVVPAWAQDKPLMRMSAVFSDKDIRAEMFGMIIKDLGADYRFEPYYMGTPVQAGHRTRRPAARQPRDRQHRAAGHQSSRLSRGPS